MVQATLTLEADGDWVKLIGQQDRLFTNFIRNEVKPAAFRKFDVVHKVWMVHWTRLPVLIPAARECFAIVDWSLLPDAWQLCIAGARGVPVASPVVEDDPFKILFVLSDAPMDVVKASYRVLSQMYHPDHGGSHDQMAKLNQAYQRVRTLRSSSSS